MFRPASPRARYVSTMFTLIAIMCGYWLLTVVSFHKLPNYQLHIDQGTFPGFGAYDREDMPGGSMRWLTNNSSIITPLPMQGWHTLAVTARIPTQARTVTLSSDTQTLTAFNITDPVFRTYTALVKLDATHPLITAVQFHSDTSELINQRYIAIGIQSMQWRSLAPWQIPTMSVLFLVFVNIIVVGIISQLWGATRWQHIIIQGTLAGVHWAILWLMIVQWNAIWPLAQTINPLELSSVLLGILLLGILLARFIRQHRTTTDIIPHHYRPDIDGIRAIAVLSVVVYHFFPDVLPGGFIGVDIFFVISGFLITQNILAQHAKQDFHIRDFYARRIRRILPALSVVLVVTSGMAWVSLFRTEFASLGTHIIASVGFFNNIHLYQSLDYFSDMAIQQPLLHLWSLGIEEQFYMVWPLLIGLLVRHPRWQSGILAGIVMLSLTINIIDIQFHPEATFYLLPSRLWQLAAGGILAHVGYGQQASPLSTTQANLLAYGAIAIIAVCVGLYHHALNYPGWYALLPTLAAVGLIAAGSHTWVNRTVLSHPVAVWVGLISYPLYLWHWPVLSFATFLAEFWLTPTVKIGLLLVSMALAAATYYLVERPIRFGRFKHLSAWVILAVFVSIGAVGWLMQSRTITVLAKPDIQNARERYQSVCGGWLGNTALPLAGTCYAYEPTTPATHRHIVIGDSHARAYTAGLVEADPQAAVFGYASDGCMPIRNFERFDNTSSQAYGCSNPLLLESALQIVQQAVHTTDLPTTIYVVGRYSLINGQGINPNEHMQVRYQEPGGAHTLATADVDTLFATGLAQTLDALITLPRTQVVFVDQAPEFPFTPLNCVRIGLFVDTSAQCVVDRHRIQAHFARYHHLVDTVLATRPTVVRYDPADTLCANEVCTALSSDQSLLYYDHHHLNTTGGAVVARHMLTTIATSP